MTIGERFIRTLEVRGIKQTALAAQFREHASRRQREFAHETVESHISRLKKGEVAAVRFFFSDLANASDLLDILEVVGDERGAFLKEAGALLSPEDRPLLAVVDLSDCLPGRAILEACEELADEIVLAVPGRVALIVTTEQRPYLLPRCTPEGRVCVETVSDSDRGRSRTLQLASDGAVVVSGRRFDPIARWIALEWRGNSYAHVGNSFALSPEQGLARLASGQAIDEVDPATAGRGLDTLLKDIAPAEPPEELAGTPVALRTLLANLTVGREIRMRRSRPYQYGTHEAIVEKELRAAWGKYLGVRALATPEEWGEALLGRAKEAGISITTSGDEKDLAIHRASVERGGSVPRAVQIGASLHVLNTTDIVRDRLSNLHGVQFHDLAQRENAAVRLQRLVQTIPIEAWLDDPYMDAAFARIDPERKDRDELEFARAALLLHNELQPPGAPLAKGWKELLGRILDACPPVVGLRVAPRRAQKDSLDLTLLPTCEVDRRVACAAVELQGIPALVAPRISRDSSLSFLTPVIIDGVRRRTYGYDPPTHHELMEAFKGLRFLLPTSAVGSNLDELISLFDHSPSTIGVAGTALWSLGRSAIGSTVIGWRREAVVTHPQFWREADLMLAAMWIALRRALDRRSSLTLHDGTGVLEMGGHLIALVSATIIEAASGHPLEADFWREPHLFKDDPLESHAVSSLVHDVGSHTALTSGYYFTRSQVEVPRKVLLSQGSTKITLTFMATPWESRVERAFAAGIEGAISGTLLAEEAAQRARDDDSDDE
ncbi:MAG: hypothetical protein HY909_07760 [Deltaproteobacteria bacterium]|nr:hypothetical protein [Deltaproteobacteria bacterium]